MFAVISFILWSLLFSVILFVASFVFLYFFTVRKYVEDTTGKRIPGPRASMFGRNIGALKHTFKFRMTQDFQELHKQHGDVFALQLPAHDGIIICDPESVKTVLSAPDNVWHKGVTYEAMATVLGQGLVTANGEVWRSHRKLAAPAFHAEKLREMVPAFVKHAKLLVEKWQADGLLDSGKTVDWHVAMTQLTGDVICDVGFGYKLDSINSNNTELPHAIEVVQSEIFLRVRDLTRLPRLIPSKRQRRFAEARGKLSSLVNGIIAARRKGMEVEKMDLLSLLMQASDDETKAKMNDKELLDETLTFLGAGHETTANMLSWMCYQLGTHPDVMEKMLVEIDACADPTNLDSLSKMHYTEAVINESMRLHPLVPVISRQSTQPTVVGGYHLPTGATVMINIYGLHRCERTWGPDAAEFKPERWLQSQSADKHATFPPHPFAFAPFSAGPRKCIGRLFAMIEAKAVLVCLFSQVKPVLVSTEEPVRVEIVTARPRDGLAVRLESRVGGAVAV